MSMSWIDCDSFMTHLIIYQKLCTFIFSRLKYAIWVIGNNFGNNKYYFFIHSKSVIKSRKYVRASWYRLIYNQSILDITSNLQMYLKVFITWSRSKAWQRSSLINKNKQNTENSCHKNNLDKLKIFIYEFLTFSYKTCVNLAPLCLKLTCHWQMIVSPCNKIILFVYSINIIFICTTILIFLVSFVLNLNVKLTYVYDNS